MIKKYTFYFDRPIDGKTETAVVEATKAEDITRIDKELQTYPWSNIYLPGDTGSEDMYINLRSIKCIIAKTFDEKKGDEQAV